jgi:acetyl esterase
VIGDPAARYLAWRTGAVVLSVDYRLVPEHRYPAPILDALAAIDWTRENAAELRVDPDRIVIAGTSSGGNIATAAALVDASRAGSHPLRGAALTAPALDLADFGTFYSSTPERRTVRSDLMAAYTGDTSPSTPTVSPAKHAAPAWFPPSVVITSSFDEVAVGSESWAASLKAAGVPVRHGLFPMTHTLGHPADERAMREFLASGIEWLIAGAIS